MRLDESRAVMYLHNFIRTALILYLLSFKLHLNPKTMELNTNGLQLGSIPKFMTPIAVFADFLEYMLDCVIQYLNESYPTNSVKKYWDKVKKRSKFVITHPNAWGGAQQQLLRQAAILARLIPNGEKHQGRLIFLTEGEASLHGCLSCSAQRFSVRHLIAEWTKSLTDAQVGDAFIVADAGGGTIDINTYEVTSTRPVQLHEVVKSDC